MVEVEDLEEVLKMTNLPLASRHFPKMLDVSSAHSTTLGDVVVMMTVALVAVVVEVGHTLG